MRIFTVSEWGTQTGAIVTFRQMPDGNKVPVVAVGEQGRGRTLCEIPVKLTVDSYRVWCKKELVQINYVRVIRTSLGLLRFEESGSEEEHDRYVVVFLGWIGFRGWNALTLADGRRLPADMVLGEGRIAQGTAGRMGSGAQWVLLVHHGDLLRFEVGGRLYGASSRYMLVCGEHKPLLYSQEVYDLEKAYEQQD